MHHLNYLNGESYMKREILEQLIDKWSYEARGNQTKCIDDSEELGRIADARESACNEAKQSCAKELGDLIKLLSY